MSALALIKILLFASKIFVIVFLLFAAVYVAFGLASLAIVGPPAMALFALRKSLDLAQKGLIWLFIKIGLADPSPGPQSEKTNTSTNSQGERASPPPEQEAEQDPYNILGVSRGASQDEIARAYREKMLKNHPDKVAHMDREFQKLANERAIILRQAFEALKKVA